jgi:DNA-binding HxlR family transcriptional regulator
MPEDLATPKKRTRGRAGAAPARGAPPTCSLGQTLAVVGERWAFLIVRQALLGSTRFSEFREELGISTDILGARLNTLVDGGVLTRQSYQGDGQRTRLGYELTDAGRQLGLVLGALQQWGDEHLPSDLAAIRFRTDEGRSATVAFVDDQGTVVEQGDVRAVSEP